MSHEITKTDSMVTAEFDKDGSEYPAPWHGLGERFREKRLMTSQECIEFAGLGWTVTKEPLKLSAGVEGSRSMIEVPDKYATVRSDQTGVDRYLGIVGEYYVPFQNTGAFEFMDSIVKKGEAAYDTAGSLFGGRKVWLLAQMPDHVIVADDMVAKYLLLSHCHDGTGMIEVMFTPIRVVCNNTCRAAVDNAQYKIKVRHTVSAGDKLEEAKNTIGIASSYFEKIGARFNDMADFEMSEARLQNYFKKLVPDPKNKDSKNTRALNIRTRLTEIFETSPVIVDTPAEGNLWGAYNAVTEFVQHEKVIPLYGNDEAEQRFDKIMLGDSGAADLSENAFTRAVKLLKN